MGELDQMLTQTELYHAASALADAIADSCRDGATDLAIEQIKALRKLVTENTYSEPELVAHLRQAGAA